jgi:hypothetical protein
VTPRHAGVGVFIAVLYVAGSLLGGVDPLPAIVAGVLAGVLAALVLREIDQRRLRRERERGGPS